MLLFLPPPVAPPQSVKAYQSTFVLFLHSLMEVKHFHRTDLCLLLHPMARQGVSCTIMLHVYEFCYSNTMSFLITIFTHMHKN